MRAYQVFSAMAPERSMALMQTLAEQTPAVFAEALAAASAMLKARPVYLRRLPFERRAEAVRRALARVAANEIAEDVLAAYFLECRRPLLVEWLETVGLAHDEGTLRDAAPSPPEPAKLRKAVARFRRKASAPDALDRELLLQAFAAQGAIDWPELEALLEARD